MPMRACESVIFDMDGTLVDPRRGIFDALKYALRRLRAPLPPNEAFSSFVGPPLRSVFSRILGTEDPGELENAVALYRERYSTSGIYDCVVYSGIVRMLEDLGDRGLNLYVATIKPLPYARRILSHFGLAAFFLAVHGSRLDGSLDEKDRLLKGLLDEQGLKSEQSLMVGDRHMDINAARANGLTSIGVTYGFGTRRELSRAGADHIVDSPAGVTSIIEALTTSR